MMKQIPPRRRASAVRSSLSIGGDYIFALAFASMLLCAANTAKATLLAYEGFNYAAGDSLTNASAAGPGDSFGWGQRWTGGNIPLTTVLPNGLSYADSVGNTLVTDGGSALVGIPSGTNSNAQPTRTLAIGPLNGNVYGGLSNGTFWISFLAQWVGPINAVPPAAARYIRKGDVAFRSGSTTGLTGLGGTEVLNAGRPTVGTGNGQFNGAPVDTWTLWNNGDGGFTAGAANASASIGVTASPLASPGGASFILIKLVLNGAVAADQAYMWVNWTNLTTEPDIFSAHATDFTTNMDGLNNIRFDGNGGNASGTNTVIQFDELRVGTDFADVAPYGNIPPPQSPSITSEPTNITVTIDDPATFTVGANGDVPLFYQWYFNTNTLLADKTNASLTLPSAQTNDAGGYSVIITNSFGSVTSVVATLTVLPPAPPSITNEPANETVIIGDPVTFTVSANGTAPLRYQWYFNTNILLADKTNASLTIPSAQTNDAGGYSVIVTNNYGSATSAVVTLTVIPPFELLPAFPGADGAAKFVTGGRGGIVYHVTMLDRNFNHAEAGTLRYGLTDGNFPPGVPRTIVFDVGGVFWLGRYGAESNYDNGWNAGQSRYNLSGNTTIAGQTAPGPVIIMGGVTKAGSANTIIRNVMFAPGYGMQGFHEPPNPPTPGDFPDSYVYDALDISGQNIMMDHLTAIYATDEAISCNEVANHLTIQNCNVSQGQNYPQADAESSTISYAGHALAHLLQAGSNAKISVLNNLYAHQRGRLPRVGSEVGTGAINDFRNNVFYNWLGTAGSGASGQPSFNNFINNFYLAGPGGDTPFGGANSNLTFQAGGTGIFSGSDSTLTRVFPSGNFKDTNKDGDPNDSTLIPNGDFGSIALQSTAYNVNIGVTLTAHDAFTNVLRYVGSRWWDRPYVFTLGNTNAITTNDIAAYVDERLIHETVAGTGKIIAWADDPFDDDPSEGTEWRSLLALRADTNTFAAPFNRPAGWDSDQDGMPDYWELEHGLNPNVADNNGDFDNDGYSNLEEYLNDITAWPAPGVIVFTGATTNRYAEIFNWQVNGVVINIAGTNVTTSSKWQPSRFDTATISNATVLVDAVGQHAGVLRLTNNATLNITNGWLKVANTLEVAAGCTAAVTHSGRLTVASNLVNNGTLRLTGQTSLNVSGSFTNNGLLDIMAWNGTLPTGFVNIGTVLDRSLVRVSLAKVDEPDFELTIQGYEGHSYQLQYRDDLSSSTWTNISVPVIGANATIPLTHPDGAIAQGRFYRVMVDP